MTAEPEQPGTNLPAPYRSPWRSLADDLRAVAADLRLRLRELLRRNGEGDLPLPSFWPRPLAAAFWPLVLAAAAGLLTLALVLLPGRQGPAEPATAPAAPPVEAPAPPEAPPAAPEAPQEPEALAEPEPPAEPKAPEEPEAPPEAEEPEPETPAAPPPLLASLAPLDPDGLITAATPSADGTTLVLALTEAYGRRDAGERQRLALAWQERAQQLGVERLELRDATERLLGRSAVVGSGMVLLDPPPGQAGP